MGSRRGWFVEVFRVFGGHKSSILREGAAAFGGVGGRWAGNVVVRGGGWARLSDGISRPGWRRGMAAIFADRAARGEPGASDDGAHVFGRGEVLPVGHSLSETERLEHAIEGVEVATETGLDSIAIRRCHKRVIGPAWIAWGGSFLRLLRSGVGRGFPAWWRQPQGSLMSKRCEFCGVGREALTREAT